MTIHKDSGIIQLDTLTKAQLNFLMTCKELGYGKLEVIVKDGEPVLSIEKEKMRKHD